MKPRRASRDPECSCGEVDEGLRMLRLDRFSYRDYTEHVEREACASLMRPSQEPGEYVYAVVACSICGGLYEALSPWLVYLGIDTICLPCSGWYTQNYMGGTRMN